MRDIGNARPTWLEIDLDKVEYNVKNIKGLLNNSETKLLAVIKGNAYGHGAIKMAQVFTDLGADMLGVAMVSEGVELRKAGIDAQILVMGPVAENQRQLVIDYNLTQTIFTLEDAEALSELAVKANKTVTVHIKIDSGMSRIGFVPSDEAVKDIVSLKKLPNLFVEGIFTHFASADEADKAFTEKQFANYCDMLESLEREGITFDIRHVANGPATLDMPAGYQLDMVRIGVMLYGYFDSPEVHQEKVSIKPAMQLMSRVSNVKTIPIGTGISYGQTWHAERESVIATIPLGYADGYPRSLSNKGHILVNGQKAPIVGRICMDQMVVDVTDCGEVNIGDEVGIFGVDHENCMTIEDIMEISGWLHAEVISNMNRRIPRVYIKNGEVEEIVDYLEVEEIVDYQMA